MGVLMIYVAFGVFAATFIFRYQVFAAPITMEVNSDGDSADANPGNGVCETATPGECTLRAAIQEANANVGADTINFEITIGASDFTSGGQNGYTIQPTSNYPQITETVTINGYSQSGSQANTAIAPAPLNGILLIEIDGQNAGLTAGAGEAIFNFQPGSENSSVRGLVINNMGFGETFTNLGDPTAFLAADGLVVAGNYVGVDPDGLTRQENLGCGVCIPGSNVDDVRIGGTAAADRNIVSGNRQVGISPNSDAANWVIQGNYIGVGADGQTAIGNGTYTFAGGLSMDYGPGHIIGGSDPGAANVISGNDSFGIAPHYSDDLVIRGNYIGVGADGTTSVPNDYDGIALSYSDNVSIEDNIIANNVGSGLSIFQNNDVVYVADNLIYNNDGDGVQLGPDEDSTDVSMVRNQIYGNTQLGIDLNSDEVTQNDTLDPDVGPNDLLNFPVYTTIADDGSDTDVAFKLDVPAGDYRVEFFSNTSADPSGYGEGQNYLGYADVTSAGAGEQSYVHTLTGVTGESNFALTATERGVATASGFGATSEFGGAAESVSDMLLTKTLTNPEDAAIGATLTYQFTVTNNGPDAVDLGIYDGSSVGVNNLVLELMPPDITYSAALGTNISCFSAGPGSASSFGTFLEDHSDHEAVFCNYTGGNNLLAAGDSISFTMDVVVQPSSDLEFTNIAFIGPVPSSDPDEGAFGAAYGSGGDFITYLGTSVNNVAYAQYPLQPGPAVSPDLGATDGVSNGLADSGYAIWGILTASVTLMAGGVGVWLYRRKFHA